MKYLLGIVVLLYYGSLTGQPSRWQQHVDYTMDIEFDVKQHQFKGTQKLTLQNNSPDTLDQVYYHLYFNAFQPGSMMDVRSRNIKDPDRRIMDRIYHLKDDEIGFLQPVSLTHDGNPVDFNVVGTILEVDLDQSVMPGTSTVFEMEFTGQVPVQIRRSGRNNTEGIDYSMSQWYPKMCNYDDQGWHANPYVAREFYGIWGNFDVKITIDPNYTIAASGLLQNKNEIGHGYEDEGVSIRKHRKPLTWHFKAEKVIDFVWAADPDYKHTRYQVPDGPELHFFYVEDSVTEAIWSKLPEPTSKAFMYMNERFGKYPYPVYSIIQGGDGGMEYPMATLITGRANYSGVLSTTMHELIHSWYQNTLANNESLYAWMDEGFTSYASAEAKKHIFNLKGDVHKGRYESFFKFMETGLAEPSSTHSDHFSTNRAYRVSAYTKGAVFLHQLSYVIGRDAFNSGMRRYYNTWKFKHPRPNDFIRIMEKESDIELDWYKEYWIYTTKMIDYGIDTLISRNNKTQIILGKKDEMPMPLDVMIEFSDGEKEIFYIPLRIMRGTKQPENDHKRTILEDWPWTHPQYSFLIDRPISEIRSIEIDPSKRMADINRDDNIIDLYESYELDHDSY